MYIALNNKIHNYELNSSNRLIKWLSQVIEQFPSRFSPLTGWKNWFDCYISHNSIPCNVIIRLTFANRSLCYFLTLNCIAWSVIINQAFNPICLIMCNGVHMEYSQIILPYSQITWFLLSFLFVWYIVLVQVDVTR